MTKKRRSKLISARRSSFFVSYAHEQPDATLAQALRDGLRDEGHEVAIDTDFPVGVEWAGRIEQDVAASDYVILLLSARSVHSQMVLEEARLANQGRKAHGKPTFLPVRVQYANGPLGYALGAWVNPYQWTTWEKPDDTPRVLAEILDIVAGRANVPASEAPDPQRRDRSDIVDRPEPIADLSALPAPGLSIRPDDPYYIKRPADRVLAEAARRLEETVVIKAPRMMGKSSLLRQYLNDCRKHGKKTALVDLSEFDDSILVDYKVFLSALARELLAGFGLDGSPTIANQLEMTRFVRDQLLRTVPDNLVIALDDADRVLGQPYQSGFFSMLRSWLDRRSDSTQPGWARMELAFVISTEPYLLIADSHRSPFNVRDPVELPPFRDKECIDLNRRYPKVLKDEQAERLRRELLNGHPFLTRLAYFRLTHHEPADLDALLCKAAEPDGPFGDHLRSLLTKLRRPGPTDLLAAMRRVCQYGTVDDDDTFYRLRGAGLVRREGKKVVPANGLYARFFGSLQ
jgi:hypothetical protein